MSNFRELSHEYLLAAIEDFSNGVSIDELKGLVVMMEEFENYEACQGISKLIKILETK